jgi:hypothetical protein
MTLKEKLREQLLVNGEFDIYGINIKNWPEDEENESLDMENYGFIELTEDKLLMWAGGDWQDPKNIEIRLVEGELTAVNTFETDDNDKELKQEEFIKLLQS